jgi:hypothetical protein
MDAASVDTLSLTPYKGKRVLATERTERRHTAIHKTDANHVIQVVVGR